MDKLQPIIKNRFWILAGLVLPLAMYGFFSANSKLKAATDTRETELKGVLSNIPAGSNDPNEEYAAGLSKINEAYSKSVEQSILNIWQTQQQRMNWPPVVETYLPRKFLGEFDYRGIVAYQEAYERLMLDLQKRVQPVMPLKTSTGAPGVAGLRPSPQQEIADVPWKQKVVLAASIPQAHFGRMRATSEEVWNAQIDIWLLRLLYDAVARLNEDKDSVTESILRRIDVLNLVGGDGQPVLTGGGSSGGSDGEGAPDEMYSGTSGSGGDSFGGEAAGGLANAVPIAFSPAQEFGSDADPDAGGGDSDGGSALTEYGGGSMMNRNAPKLRYIADAEDKPFLERGFYMSVIIMQDKIPDFLVELANSEWPVRITRFHVGKNPYYTGATSSGSPYGGSYMNDNTMYQTEDAATFSGRGAATYNSETTLGGIGGNLKGIEGVGSLTNNLPQMATDAMQHPNLVQLDLCGIITMYKQPQSIIDAIENGVADTAPVEEAAPLIDGNEALPVEPAAPQGADPETLPEEAADPAKTITEPTTEPAATTPPAAEPESTNSLEPENL